MKHKNLCLLVSTIASTVFACGIASISYAEDKLEDVGIQFRNSDSLNKKIVKIIKYVGTCPGSGRESIIGRFVHNEVPTKKKRRVRIYNETLADASEEIPYTDRKYKKKNKSSKISFDFGSNHKESKFVIKPGTNKLSYQIYNGKYGKSNMEVVEEGNFLVNVEKSPTVTEIQRDIEYKAKVICVDKNGNAQPYKSLDDCKYAGSQKVGTCNGATVSSHLTNIWRNDRYKKKK
ncbi:MAG: hypothetical protein KI793_25790 [Rivularia sp. (in: Bacteria)]|nr:hypothetical protein [Rivularia sp. MS3]